MGARRNLPVGKSLACPNITLRPLPARPLIEIQGPAAYTESPLDAVGGKRGVVGIGDAVMSRSTYFVQECPTCGRNLQVRIQYLGKQVVCQHCGARFEAYDPGSASYPAPPSGMSLLERAEQLLQSSASHIGVPVGAGVATDVVPVRPK